MNKLQDINFGLFKAFRECFKFIMKVRSLAHFIWRFIILILHNTNSGVWQNKRVIYCLDLFGFRLWKKKSMFFLLVFSSPLTVLDKYRQRGNVIEDRTRELWRCNANGHPPPCPLTKYIRTHWRVDLQIYLTVKKGLFLYYRSVSMNNSVSDSLMIKLGEIHEKSLFAFTSFVLDIRIF